MTPERPLVNFFYAHPIGHAIEALYYCVGHHAADLSREISVALNSATATELAAYCPFVSDTFAIDHPLVEPCPDSPDQLAIVEASDLLLAPHTGFGMAALAVGTPWLALSGGRWFEYFFNHVPFRSIIPDPDRYPSFSMFQPAPVIDDADEGPRTPSMSEQRFREDLARIVTAAGELLDHSLGYEQSLRDYFPALLAACGHDPGRIWSIDGVHLDYV